MTMRAGHTTETPSTHLGMRRMWNTKSTSPSVGMVFLSRLPLDYSFASGRHLAHERLGRSGSNTKKSRHTACTFAGFHSKAVVFGAIAAADFFERHGYLPRTLARGRCLGGAELKMTPLRAAPQGIRYDNTCYCDSIVNGSFTAITGQLQSRPS